MFIFLDESGDLGFDWGKEGTSKYFTVTVLTCDSKQVADGIRRAVRKTIRNKLHPGKSNRKVYELKGTSSSIEVKKYFSKNLPKEGINIYSVTINKETVDSNLKTKDGKKKLYNFLARFIIERIPLKNILRGNVDLVVDKCKNTAEIKDFNQYIENQLCSILPLKTKLNIEHESSQNNPCLQAVDLFCWGIARKYKDNNKAWYECFEYMVQYDEIYEE